MWSISLEDVDHLESKPNSRSLRDVGYSQIKGGYLQNKTLTKFMGGRYVTMMHGKLFLGATAYDILQVLALTWFKYEDTVLWGVPLRGLSLPHDLPYCLLWPFVHRCNPARGLPQFREDGFRYLDWVAFLRHELLCSYMRGHPMVCQQV